MKHEILTHGKAYRFRRFARKAYSAFNSMHKIVNIGVLTSCMLTFAPAKEAAAQTNQGITPGIEKELELEEVTITASRAEMKLNQAAKLVTVITKTQIEQSPAQSVEDLLKQVVGVDVRQRGANGVQSDISVRGGTFDQVAILLNGANLSNPQTGHYSFDIPVNLADIEQIEIIQGPTSLLYGASAFAGGINIITKKQPGTKAYAGLEGGMHQSMGATAGGSLQSGTSTHRLSLGYNTSDGYTDNSDYDIFNSLWQSNFRVERSKLDVQLGYNQKQYGANTFYSAAYPNQCDNTRSVFASARGETGDKLKIIPQIYWNRHYDIFELVRGTNQGKNYHQSDVYGFNLNMQYKSAIGITSFGGEFRNEGILSSLLGKPMESPDGKYTRSDNRSNISYFAEQNFLINQFSASAGVLVNHNTSQPNDYSFYPSVNLSYRVIDNASIYTSWSKAMRMPTFTDLYYTTKTHTGNISLKPEKSESVELGMKFSNRLISSYITGFYMKGQDIIDWVKVNPDDLWESRNLTELDKKGIETSFGFHLKEIFHKLPVNTEFNIAYMYLDQTKDAGNLISNYALDYLKHKFTAGLSLPVRKGLTVDCLFRWQDRQGSYTKYENLKPATEVPYPAYSIVDLKLNWKHKEWGVYVNCNNLFNTEYYDLGNIPQPGFWLMGGVAYTFTGN